MVKRFREFFFICFYLMAPVTSDSAITGVLSFHICLQMIPYCRKKPVKASNEHTGISLLGRLNPEICSGDDAKANCTVRVLFQAVCSPSKE